MNTVSKIISAMKSGYYKDDAFKIHIRQLRYECHNNLSRLPNALLLCDLLEEIQHHHYLPVKDRLELYHIVATTLEMHASDEQVEAAVMSINASEICRTLCIVGQLGADQEVINKLLRSLMGLLAVAVKGERPSISALQNALSALLPLRPSSTVANLAAFLTELLASTVEKDISTTTDKDKDT
jgi:hypothetical protein